MSGRHSPYSIFYDFVKSAALSMWGIVETYNVRLKDRIEKEYLATSLSVPCTLQLHSHRRRKMVHLLPLAVSTFLPLLNQFRASHTVPQCENAYICAICSLDY